MFNLFRFVLVMSLVLFPSFSSAQRRSGGSGRSSSRSISHRSSGGRSHGNGSHHSNSSVIFRYDPEFYNMREFCIDHPTICIRAGNTWIIMNDPD